MPAIITTIIILGVTGVVGAVLLYFVSRRFRVDEDPRVESIAALMPGANCGGCGLKGCRDFACACVAAGRLDGLYCPVGGDAVMKTIAGILGTDAAASEQRIAVVRCAGSCSARPRMYIYQGPRSCAVEAAAGAGTTGCAYGCLGCGDCTDVCQFGAIAIDPATGLPVVDPARCTACGKCVGACPRGLIELRGRGRRDRRVWVACSSRARGAVARKACSAACIGCGKCARTCPFGAITVTDNLARIDASLCRACGKCIGVCPTGAVKATFTMPKPVVNENV